MLAHTDSACSPPKSTLWGKKKERVEEKAMGTVDPGGGGGGVMGEPLATNGYFSHHLLPGHQSPKAAYILKREPQPLNNNSNVISDLSVI